MEIFQTLGSGALSVTAMLDFSGKANASIHGPGEDDTARTYLEKNWRGGGGDIRGIFLISLKNPMPHPLDTSLGLPTQ